MAFPNAHLYLRCHGSLGGNYATNEEKWTVGLRLGIVGADVPYNAVNLKTFVNAAGAALHTFVAGSSSKCGTAVWFHNASVARVGPDGKYLPQAQETVYSDDTPERSTGSPVLPWNSCQVISLRTGQFRGFASNGRLYFPQLTGGIDANSGRVLPSHLAPRMDAAKVMIDEINDAAQVYATNMRVVVASKTGGIQAVVTSIRSDERIDSIERRENAAPAVWMTRDISPS